MKVGEAYVGEDGQWSYYTEKDVFEHTTYNSEFALHALAEGFTVYVTHPEDDWEDDQLFNAWQIADADGHMFVIRKEQSNG